MRSTEDEYRDCDEDLQPHQTPNECFERMKRSAVGGLHIMAALPGFPPCPSKYRIDSGIIHLSLVRADDTNPALDMETPAGKTLPSK